ncbi:MAG: hypothetical protein HRU10_04360 [Opitutales bacterium]|nr:hypothetical protein [Opitutales bacterium]
MACVAFGEILWDVIEGREYLGVAPLNVCVHLVQLGLNDVSIYSAVGSDLRGSRALKNLEARNFDTIGAGDALIAGYLFDVLHGYTPPASLDLGMRLTDSVVSHAGATPVIDAQRILPSS